MKCVLLAAGYATRLYPLTKDLPKSLLLVGGKTILEHILAKVDEVPEIDEIILVSNELFYTKFIDFTEARDAGKLLRVLSDGTMDNAHRRGAIADLVYAIDVAKIKDDILVLAADNIFDFSLRDFVAFFEMSKNDCVTVYEEKDLIALRKTGVAELDEKNRLLSFEEKPQHPRSNFAIPPFYIYSRRTIDLIREYSKSHDNQDAPGNLVKWLVERKTIYAYKFLGTRYDIGSLESYEATKKAFC